MYVSPVMLLFSNTPARSRLGLQYSESTVRPLGSSTYALCLCSLLAANYQFSIFIGQKMQLTGLDNANNMCNATYADTRTSNEWPYRLIQIHSYIRA